MSLYSEEQLLTIKKINKDQSRIIDSKQQIIEDQARLINNQQQLIDMMYDNIKSLKDEINKLQSEIGEGNSSQHQPHQNSHHNKHQYRQNPGYGSSNGAEHYTENLSSNDFDHEENNDANGYRVLLRNVKNSISNRTLKNQLEREFGPIYDISPNHQKKTNAFVYFKNRDHYIKALEEGRIAVDNVLIQISSGKSSGK